MAVGDAEKREKKEKLAIEELEKAKFELNQNKQMGDILLNTIPGGVALYHIMEDGTVPVSYISEGLANVCGYTAKEFINKYGSDSRDCVVKEDVPVIKEALIHLLKTHKPIRNHFRLYKKNGDTVVVSFYGNILENNVKKPGEIASLYAVQTIISDDGLKILEAEANMQNLLEYVPGGIAVYDIYDGKAELKYISGAYLQMMKLHREDRMQYYGRDIVQAVKPEDRACVYELIRCVEQGSQTQEALFRVQCGDGEWKWIKLRLNAIKKGNGHFTGYGALADFDSVVEARMEQEARYEEQIRYNNMLVTSSVASSMVNLTQNNITLQKSQKTDMHRIISSQTPQQGFEAMYPLIPDEEIREDYKKIFNAKNITAEYNKGVTHKEIQHPYISFDCWYNSGYNAVKNPKNGDLEVYCYANDVSVAVENNDINKNLTRLSYDVVMLINSTTGEPNIIMGAINRDIFDEQLAAADYNLGLVNFLLKYSADENPRQIAKDLSLEAVKKALESQKSYKVTYSVYDKYHNLTHKNASFFYLNKYKTKILCTIQDITKVMEKEKQQRELLEHTLDRANKASQAKAEFYSQMSHDMRTPMNGILGMAVLAEEETDISVLKEDIKKIRSSGEYLLTLINDTLDMQRIESGKLKLEPQIVNTVDLVKDILDMIRPVAKAKGVTLEFDEGNVDLNWHVDMDGLRLKQIFLNLLSNAVKFTPPGGKVEFIFKLLGREGMISHDVIIIRDSGIGMSKEFLHKGIFKPFSQENNEVSATYTGSGLGLSIVKSLVELMGGHIEVESQLGMGTTFKVYLDFKRVDPKEVENFNSTALINNKELYLILKGRHFLLVEDNIINAEITKKLLGKKGCEVTWVTNGKEAVECFRKSEPGTFDAILMDMCMPVMDGVEATKCIRALTHPSAKTIPIIAMTANAYSEDVKRCIEAGMNAHLGKPIEPQKMYETIVAYIMKNKETQNN